MSKVIEDVLQFQKDILSPKSTSIPDHGSIKESPRSRNIKKKTKLELLISPELNPFGIDLININTKFSTGTQQKIEVSWGTFSTYLKSQASPDIHKEILSDKENPVLVIQNSKVSFETPQEKAKNLYSKTEMQLGDIKLIA